MNIQNEDLPDESDSSDEDFDPGIKEDDVSEVDSDGEPEEPLSGDEESNTRSKIKKRKKGMPKKKKDSNKESIECGKFLLLSNLNWKH